MPEPTNRCSDADIEREYDAAVAQVNANHPTSPRIRPFADCQQHARRPVFLFARRMYELGRAHAEAADA